MIWEFSATIFCCGIMAVVDRYRCWNLWALPSCYTRYNSEVNVKMLLLPCTDALPRSFPPPVRSQKSHVSTDDVCIDSSVGVFHSEAGLKTPMVNSLQRVCGVTLRPEVCMYLLLSRSSRTERCFSAHFLHISFLHKMMNIQMCRLI